MPKKKSYSSATSGSWMTRTVQLLRHDVYNSTVTSAWHVQLYNYDWNQACWWPIRFKNFDIVVISNIITLTLWLLQCSCMWKWMTNWSYHYELLWICLVISLFCLLQQAADSWFQRKCRKVNHSSGALSFLVPSFLNATFSGEGKYLCSFLVTLHSEEAHWVTVTYTFLSWWLYNSKPLGTITFCSKQMLHCLVSN